MFQESFVMQDCRDTEIPGLTSVLFVCFDVANMQVKINPVMCNFK